MKEVVYFWTKKQGADDFVPCCKNLRMPNHASNSHIELLNLNMLNNTLKMEDQVMEACHVQAYKRPYNSLLLNRQHTAYLQKKFQEGTILLIQNQHVIFIVQ